jgi:hypothetical protein
MNRFAAISVFVWFPWGAWAMPGGIYLEPLPTVLAIPSGSLWIAPTLELPIGGQGTAVVTATFRKTSGTTRTEDFFSDGASVNHHSTSESGVYLGPRWYWAKAGGFYLQPSLAYHTFETESEGDSGDKMARASAIGGWMLMGFGYHWKTFAFFAGGGLGHRFLEFDAQDVGGKVDYPPYILPFVLNGAVGISLPDFIAKREGYASRKSPNRMK